MTYAIVTRGEYWLAAISPTGSEELDVYRLRRSRIESRGRGSYIVLKSPILMLCLHSELRADIVGRFLDPVDADDLVFGNMFEKPIKSQLPWGSSIAIKAMQ